jgi:putative DNA methylase
MPKKLIEVALPLTEINEATAAEKRTTARLAHPAKIHQWWARRPLVASRAVLFAQLVDDPSAHPDKFPDADSVRTERERLFNVMRGLLDINGPSPSSLEAAIREIRSSVGDQVVVIDPFCGGGSIPIEAQRLGAVVFASDLNPVAVLLNKLMLDDVRCALGRKPIHADDQRLQSFVSGSGLSGLAEDLEWYGERLRNSVRLDLDHLYPPVHDQSGREVQVVAWIWARTVPCPNPVCGIGAPLVRSFMLSKKAGREAWVDPVTDGPGHEVVFRVRSGKTPRVSNTVGRSGAKCVACQSSIPLTYVREKASSGQMAFRLMAVAALGDRRRIYLDPTSDQELAAQVQLEDPLGTELPEQALGFRVQAYGMRTHASLFTPRQLATLSTLVKRLEEIRVEVTEAADGDVQYAKLLVTLLGLAISKTAETSNSLSRWLVKDEVPVALFARQAIPMVWDFPESNVLGESSGSFSMVVSNIARSVSGQLASYERKQRVTAEQANAATRDYPCNVVVCTDPPYFDNIGYADLADFFYVWLRLSLREVNPELFATVLTPKVEELVATPFRFQGGQQEANEHFESGFRDVFSRIRERHHSDIPITIFYAYKQEDNEDDEAVGETGAGATGWEKLLQGMVDTGLQITATWPMRTEMGNRMIGLGTNSLASSVVLACRPRWSDAGVTDRQGFIRHLRRELAEKLPELQSGGVQPVDMAQASIGPGMAVFTSYTRVLEGGDRQMSVGSALQIINQVLDELQSEQESEFDADTRWAVTWFAQNGMNAADFGDAQNIATARGTAVNALEKAGIIEARAGRVRLLSRDEYANDWDPTTDKRLTVWEVCQHLIRRIEGDGGLMAAAALLRQVGGLGDAARDLAYRLYEIANRNGWSEEARAYNNLAAEWPDLVALAAQAPSDPSTLF